jgi:glutathione S-transferase
MTDPGSEALALRERVIKLSSEPVSRPTLVYFDIIGIGWPIRALLHLAEVDYELIQISIVQWGQVDDAGERILKPVFTNGHVPLYVDSEVTLNLSALILEHLGERHGLLASEGPQRIAAQEVMGHAYDALFSWSGLLGVTVRRGLSDNEAQRRFDAFMGEGVFGLSTNGYRINLDAFVRYLIKNPSGSGCFVGDSLSVADLHAFNVLNNWYRALDPTLFASLYPELEAFVKRIKALPKIRDYIDHHQERTIWFNLPQVAMRLTSEEELAEVCD